MKMNYLRAAACLGITALLPLIANAQLPTTTDIVVDSIETPAGANFSIVFTDEGTGASDYLLEVSPSVGPDADWKVDGTASVNSIGGNQYRATTARPLTFGAYRLVAFNATGEQTAEFASPTIELSEDGGGLELLILFSKPFTGTLNYTVGGTAGTQFNPLTGSVSVINAMTAKLPIQLNDDSEINEMRFLTLSISNGTSLLGGGNSQALITVLENDALWEGSILSDGLELAFQYRQTSNAGAYQAALISDGTGALPSGEYAAQLGSTSFPATINGINVDAADSALNQPSSVSILLEVQDGVGDDRQTDTEIEGTATVTTTYASMPHLNSVRIGRFILFKPAAAPSSAEVNLVVTN